MKVYHRFAIPAVLLTGVAVLLTGLTVAARAETPKPGEKISLKLKLAKGDKKSFVSTQDMTNQISIGGQNVEIKTKLTMNSNMEVKDVAENGVSTLDVIHKRVQLTATGPVEMTYDSDDPATANNVLAQQVKGLAGQSVTAKYDSRGKVVETKAAENAEISAKLQESLDQMFSGLPSAPVAVGDTWEDEYDLKSDPNLPMKISGKYTLKEVRDGVAYVKYEAKITSTADIKGTIEGDAEVDQKTGLPIKSAFNLKAEGSQSGADFKLDSQLTLKAE
jgi:hypothetical protein